MRSSVRICIVTGSAGLIGADTVRFFSEQGFKVVGIDNDMRSYFFGESSSTSWSRKRLTQEIPDYVHVDLDSSHSMGATFS